MDAPKPCWAFENFRGYVPTHGWIRDYLAYAIQCTDAPPMYHILAAIALIANALAPEHECVVDGEPIPIHDFFLIVGESGNRKSAAIKRAIRLVMPCYAECKLEDRIWFPESCTPEGIIGALFADPNRLMVLTEWCDLLGSGRANYWQHAPQFWEMIFDRMPIQRLKMQTQVKIDRPSITILGASTPSLVKRHTVLNDWEAGKMARYLIGYMSKPEDKEMVNAIERSDLVPDLQRRYSELLSPTVVKAFVPSAEAKAYKDAWQYSADWKAFVRSMPEHLQPSALRAGDHVYRVATLYQASQTYPWSLVITVETMSAAIQLVWWCLTTLQEAFSILPVHEHQPLTRVRAALNGVDAGGISRRDLLRKVHMHGGELDRSIATLMECEEVIRVNIGGKIYYRRFGSCHTPEV